MRRWTINGRFLTQPMTGVQRHAHEVVRALDARLAAEPSLARELELEVVAPPGAELPELRAIPARRAGRIGGHVWEQVVLAAEARGGLLSLCNTGPVAHRRQIVCIHDVNTRVCPESYAPAFRALYRVLMPALGRTCRSVATVSEYSARELARLRVCAPEKIVLTPNGHEHALAWVPEHSDTTLRVASRRTVVLIGSPAPHKNVGLILGLAPRLAEAGLGVAVVGAADPRVFERVPQDAAGVRWLGRLSDAELAALLRDCLCLAFPSRVEGFGLPPLEAMALGCPVVSSDRASLPEICGAAALYAPPDDPEAWLRRLLELHRDPSLRADLAARGRAQARRFRWSAAAERYLGAMAAADGLPAPVAARAGLV